MNRISKTCLLLIIVLVFTINLKSQEIFDAVSKGDLAKVKELVDKDPGLVKARNSRQVIPLHVAAEIDNEEIAKYLIEKGSDISALNTYSYTPLMFAGIKVTKLLVEKGADINFKINNEPSPVEWAFQRRNKEKGEYLISLGANLPRIETAEGVSLLRNAIKSGNITYLEKCLSQDKNATLIESEYGNTLIHYAAESNSTELINKLISVGVDVNKKNINGLTALHVAAHNGNTDVVEFLIKKGLNKEVRTNSGNTSFNLATEAKKTETVNYLVSAGADQSAKSFRF